MDLSIWPRTQCDRNYYRSSSHNATRLRHRRTNLGTYLSPVLHRHGDDVHGAYDHKLSCLIRAEQLDTALTNRESACCNMWVYVWSSESFHLESSVPSIFTSSRRKKTVSIAACVSFGSCEVVLGYAMGIALLLQ